jgi:hypothetical protein
MGTKVNKTFEKNDIEVLKKVYLDSQDGLNPIASKAPQSLNELISFCVEMEMNHRIMSARIEKLESRFKTYMHLVESLCKDYENRTGLTI